MKYRAFTNLQVLAAGLCIALLWALTGKHSLEIHRQTPRWSADDYLLKIERGQITLTQTRIPHGQFESTLPLLICRAHSNERLLGFSSQQTIQTSGIIGAPEIRQYQSPRWASASVLFTLLIALAFDWYRRSLARRRVAQGKCGRCGYDLRATLNRCPECGAAAIRVYKL